VGLNQDIRTGNEIREAGPETGAELIRDAGGFAQVLPRDKREVVLTLRNKLGNVVGMTGDGVNDAPALSSAQVGIAVDGATDAAKGAAAIILTTPGLSAIYGGVAESRRIFARLRSYVQYRFAATFHVVVFLSVLSLAYKCEIKPLYVILLAMFNDLTLTPVSNDYASASRSPVDPSLVPILGLAAVYGCVYVAGSLIYYDLATSDGLRLLEHSDDTKRCTRYVQAALFLQISLAAEFLIFSARAPGVWFLSTPHPMLVATCLAGCVITSLLVKYAKGFGDLTWPDVGVAWLYSFLVFNVADLAKLAFLSIWGTSKGVLDEHWADHIDDESLEDPSMKDSSLEDSTATRRVRVVPPPPAPTFTNFLYHGTSYDGAPATDPAEVIWPKGMKQRRGARLGSVAEDTAAVPDDILGTPFYHAARGKSTGW
jgi:H+-transporting ATPase